MYENPQFTIITDELNPGKITWRSPSNLALIKYWGKYGVQMPRNPSISFTLEHAFTDTTLHFEPKIDTNPAVNIKCFFRDEFDEKMTQKVQKFLTQLLPIYPFLSQMDLEMDTANSFPHGAGIASSASGMSALSLCLCSLEDQLFGTLKNNQDFEQKASYLSRLGSGSACRSIYSKVALWGEIGEVQNSSDYFAIPYEENVHPVYHTFHNDILIVSTAEKNVSSSAGHALMDGNIYADNRYTQARQRMLRLLPALKNGDLETFGQIVEDEALTLHALMMCSNPSYILLHPNSLAIIEKIRNFRQETKLPLYFSIDAGPNIHLLYPSDIMDKVYPFVQNVLKPLCENGFVLNDNVGDGPEEL